MEDKMEDIGMRKENNSCILKEFVAFLQTDKAITVFEDYGFSSAQ